MLFNEAKDAHRILNILSQMKRLLDKKENNPLTSEVLIGIFKKIDLEQSWRVRLFGSYWDFHFFLKQPIIEKQPFSGAKEVTEHKLIYGSATDGYNFDVSQPLAITRVTSWIVERETQTKQEHAEIREAELLVYVPPSKEVIDIIREVATPTTTD